MPVRVSRRGTAARVGTGRPSLDNPTSRLKYAKVITDRLRWGTVLGRTGLGSAGIREGYTMSVIEGTSATVGARATRVRWAAVAAML
jgi:hypothetical protein